MVDIFLFRDILNMCRFFGCRLLLVGDDNQLQSIGPGAVLRNIILCGAFNVTKLTTIKRQSTGSLINNIKEMNYGLITPDDFTDDSIQLLHIGEFINSGAIMADAIVRLIYKNKLTIGNSILL
jgi:exodeoxyribonuclease V alpha subunit